MKKIFIAALAGLVLYTAFYKPKQPLVIIAAKHHQVILYATSWCAYCKKTRTLLKENQVKYTEFDIEKSAAGLKQYEQLNGKGVPVIDVRGLVVHGYDKNEILEALKGMKVI
ncbi:MAG: glutaredoxin family protein [Methylophilaceae bacterium]